MATAPQAPEVRIERTVRQICTPDGTPYKGYLTASLWVNQADPYAKTDGNRVEPVLTGEDYYLKLAAAIAAAETSVYMLGWQINWDVMLDPQKKLRLYDAVLAATKAKPKLKVYVLPWDDSAPLDTGDDQTAAVLTSINKQLGGEPRVFVTLATERPNASAGMDMFFSHHQKQVVIDNRVAFVGGLDVAYGRRDSATFALNATGLQGNDAYNGCVPRLLGVKPEDYVDALQVTKPENVPTGRGPVMVDEAVKAAKASLNAGKVQAPFGGAMLDASRQPRMPWQDVHLRIEGPAVSDLASNFVLRWNSASSQRLALPAHPDTYAKPGSCCVQMLRSASNLMVAAEAKTVTPEERSRVHAKSGHNHIYHAMVRLIEHADHFIYIENQFFVSAFGQVGFGDKVTRPPLASPEIELVKSGFNTWASRRVVGNQNALPTNRICEALGAKLADVILDVGNPSPDGKTSQFHVYITLPVHPEGPLNDPTVMTQIHYTMQTLVFGSQSLINRIRRAIKARQLLDKQDSGFQRALAEGNDEYKDVPIEHCWPYLTLLNLRNWEQLGDRYVTEQVYVHTKMMVVDDRYAIVGSANINDRSQTGDRDSELAVLVMDTDYSYEDIGASEGVTVVRKFARELRMGVWNKIFGNTGGKRAAGLADAIRRPAAQASWEDIRELATKNSGIYEAAFPFVPRNPLKKERLTDPDPPSVSIWPTVTMVGVERAQGLMPFDPAFWATPQHTPAAAALKDVKGYITLLPWMWTAGQNNNSGMHSALFAGNMVRPTPVDDSVIRVEPSQASNGQSGSSKESA